jgi:hypothetical protein
LAKRDLRLGQAIRFIKPRQLVWKKIVNARTMLYGEVETCEDFKPPAKHGRQLSLGMHIDQCHVIRIQIEMVHSQCVPKDFECKNDAQKLALGSGIVPLCLGEGPGH